MRGSGIPSRKEGSLISNQIGQSQYPMFTIRKEADEMKHKLVLLTLFVLLIIAATSCAAPAPTVAPTKAPVPTLVPPTAAPTVAPTKPPGAR